MRMQRVQTVDRIWQDATAGNGPFSQQRERFRLLTQMHSLRVRVCRRASAKHPNTLISSARPRALGFAKHTESRPAAGRLPSTFSKGCKRAMGASDWARPRGKGSDI